MLFMGKLEGKHRMAREEFMDQCQRATATTVRMAKGAGLGEKGKRLEDVVGCTINGDSWFASLQTCKALMGELGIHFVGDAKTVTKNFPKEAAWACLHELERNDHVVFANTETGIHAVGWNNGDQKGLCVFPRVLHSRETVPAQQAPAR